jgi:hypothetical protein
MPAVIPARVPAVETATSLASDTPDLRAARELLGELAG